MKDEIKGVVRLFDEVYSTFGLTYHIELSTMPEDHMGNWRTGRRPEKTLQRPSRSMGKDLRGQRGRRRVLRPEAGLPSGRRHRPYLAVRHHPAGYADARAL